MSSTKKQLSPTKVQLIFVGETKDLAPYKEQALRELAKDMKIQGFRPGKAPLNLVEKQANPALLQNEFLERAVSGMYGKALDEHKLRTVAQPNISIKKFVPFDTLEVEAEVEVIGEVTLGDYKKLKLSREKVTVPPKEVEEVIKQLLTREAEKKDVDRAAKEGDQVWIDFKGVDAKTKEAIQGADGKDYPLLLGSNTFIPGFETNLVGAKSGEEREFTLTFPKDYGVKALQNRKITFTVTVKKVQEVVSPKVDDAFAAKVGPFKTVAELKDDIKKELTARKEADTEQKHTDDLLRKIAEKSKVAIPEVMIDEQLDRIEREQRQNLTYRGLTWQEYLKAEGLAEEAFRKKHRPDAELRVKAGIVLAEIAEAEKITVTPEEFNAQMQALKARYPDTQMQAELEKPENRRDILSRMLTEKTIAKIKEYAAS